MRSIFGTLLLLLFLPVGVLRAASEAPGKLIDIGGRQLHLVCTGSGEPTVVFESGLGEGWYSWALVQPKVAEHVRACSYDRSGIGFSDADDSPRSVTRLVNDLHQLLAKSGEHAPYILVGHSLGGLLVRRYAATFPKEVAGIVLVDSVHEQGRVNAPPELLEAQEKALAARREQLKQWHATGKFEEMPFHEKLPTALVRLLTPRTATAAWWDARFAENTLPDFEGDGESRTRHLDVPLIVITATRYPLPKGFPAEAWTKNQTNRLRLQKELVSRSNQARQIMTNTGHHVQLEDPAVVVDAIMSMAGK